MTSSDDLRGDQRSQKDRIDYSDLQEFQTLRALLRPRMDQVGASSTTEALRGLFVELEAANERAAAEHRLAIAAAAGHDHVRELLLAIAGVFGRFDDLDSLPKVVAETAEDWRRKTAEADAMRNKVYELDKQRVLTAAKTAAERKQLEAEVADLVRWRDGSEKLQAHLNELTAELIAVKQRNNANAVESAAGPRGGVGDREGPTRATVHCALSGLPPDGAGEGRAV